MYLQPTKPTTPSGWLVLAWFAILGMLALGAACYFVPTRLPPKYADLIPKFHTIGNGCFAVGGVLFVAAKAIRWFVNS